MCKIKDKEAHINKKIDFFIEENNLHKNIKEDMLQDINELILKHKQRPLSLLLYRYFKRNAKKYFKNYGKERLYQMYYGDQIFKMRTCENIDIKINFMEIDKIMRKTLNVKEYDSINFYFGTNGNKKRTLSEIGEILFVSRSRVGQYIESGLKKVRKSIASSEIYDSIKESL